MDLVLTVIGVLALGFLINVILKQTYNFIFFFAKKPILWSVLITGVAALLWFICAFSGASVSVPFWASAIALYMNWPPKLTKNEKELAKEMYVDMGLPKGPAFYRLGLFGFVTASLISWLVFYSESCDKFGNCIGFFG